MAKKTVKKAKATKEHTPQTRVLGIASPKSMAGQMLSDLIDGKWHNTVDFKEYRKREKDSVGYFLTVLKRKSAHAERPFTLELENDGEKVRLIFRAAKSKNGASAKSTAPKAKAKVKAASAGTETETEVSRASVQDVPASDD